MDSTLAGVVMHGANNQFNTPPKRQCHAKCLSCRLIACEDRASRGMRWLAVVHSDEKGSACFGCLVHESRGAAGLLRWPPAEIVKR